MADEVGQNDIRGINIDKGVTGFALAKFVFKDRLCLIQNSSNWQEKYYSETRDVKDNSGYSLAGIPRLASFPVTNTSWTLNDSFNSKFGNQVTISEEDMISNEVDVIVRELIRNAEAVVKKVDTAIWNVVTQNQLGDSPQTINSLAIDAGHEWNSATINNRDPIQNLLDAKVEIANYDYDVEGAYLCINPKDYANLLGNANVRNAGQFYTADVTRRGNVGTIVGLNILVSPNVTADKAAIIIGKTAATWKQLKPLRTVKITDEGIGVTIRSWEYGVCQLKNPRAVCFITNTST